MATFALTGLDPDDPRPGGRELTFRPIPQSDWMAYAEATAERYALRVQRQELTARGLWSIEVGRPHPRAGMQSVADMTHDLIANVPSYIAVEIRLGEMSFAGTGQLVPTEPQTEINTAALTTIILTLRSHRAEARALRRELAHPPLGHSVAVWQAYVATQSETACGKRVEMTASHLQLLRFGVEQGLTEIPARILRHAGQLFGSAR